MAPVLAAVNARRVVEIGALRGENTVQMLDFLGPDCDLHVIDPVPDFDPVEHAKKFGGNYHFHQALSLEVLSTLPAMDAALIDGDHNWYTVYNEMRQLADVARAAGKRMPVMILHDVGWPYGRRDLYYDPSNIPAEHRQPYDQKGMRPAKKELLKGGGLNPTMCNALVEGGERNGVMTGVDDFVAEYDRPLRLLMLPVYFGLAIVAEEAHLAEVPALAAAFDRLESAEGRYDLMVMTEETRLDAMIFQHNVHYKSEERFTRATGRYLAATKLGLADAPGAGDGAILDHLENSLDAMRASVVRGDLFDCGTGAIGTLMSAWVAGHEQPNRDVWVLARDVEAAGSLLERHGLLDANVHVLGPSPSTALSDIDVGTLGLIHIGPGTDVDVTALLEQLYPKLSVGGTVIVSAGDNVRSQLDAFRAAVGATGDLEVVDEHTLRWCKTAQDVAGTQ
jgi:hypothetical protein